MPALSSVFTDVNKSRQAFSKYFLLNRGVGKLITYSRAIVAGSH